MQKLKDKTIIITGPSSGLGKAIALKLAEEGCNLCLISRNKTALTKVMEAVIEKGSKCKIFPCDLTISGQIIETLKQIHTKYKNVDVLINNAGIWYEGPTEKHSKKVLTALYETNVLGLTSITQEVLHNMKENNAGQILNVSSSAGLSPSGNWSIYTGSKYAVRGFTDSLKMELSGTGIKVMGFYPGGMNTELFNTSGFPKSNEPWMMQPEDVAEIITFMLKQPDDIIMDSVSVSKNS